MSRRIVVIGAGMVGICAASWLKRDGHSVTVIDSGAPGEGASFGNAGCLNASSVVPMAMPGTIWKVPGWLLDPLAPLAIRRRYLPTLAPWLWRFVRAGNEAQVRRTAAALRALLAPSLQRLMPLAADAGIEGLVHRAGHLFAYRSEAAFQADRAAWDLRQANGVSWESFDADGLRQLEPALTRAYRRGILVQENGHVDDPLALVQGLAAALVRNGGEIRRARALGFVLDGGRVRTVRTDAGELAADAAVLAAGAHSGPLAAALGDRLPLETERGYHAMVRDPEVMPRLPVSDAHGKFVATPMRQGLRLAGTVELAGLEAPPDWRRARVLLEAWRQLLPGLAPEPDAARLSFWMGHRPSLPDSLPAIGRSRASPDIIYAFGHGHVGMAGAPMTGRLVADLVAARPPAIELAPFDPARFA
ncbi:MAG: NAD(P)/FAD-dependent oxidoreductase [Stellaceae bacterium]